MKTDVLHAYLDYIQRVESWKYAMIMGVNTSAATAGTVL